MSAAANAAGFLYASGRLRGSHGKEVEKKRRQQEAERAAEALRLEREANEKRRKDEATTAA